MCNNGNDKKYCGGLDLNLQRRLCVDALPTEPCACSMFSVVNRRVLVTENVNYFICSPYRLYLIKQT